MKMTKKTEEPKISRGLFIGAGIFLIIAGIATIILDFVMGPDFRSIYYSYLLLPAGAALIYTGIKGRFPFSGQ